MSNISDSVKILIFASAVLITCILVTLGYRAAETAADISNHAILQMSELNDDIKDSNLIKYHETEITGSEVVNCMKKYLGDYDERDTAAIYIEVRTNSSDNTYQNNLHLSEVKAFGNERYIKPTAIFQGKVIKNENKVIIGLTFIQR